MKKKDIATALIDRVDYPNKGHFTVPETGEEGLVKNVIPGQKVRFRVYKKHGDMVYGNRLGVEEPSPMETRQAVCAHFGSCGGCLYQTLPYETQLSMKEEQIKRLFAGIVSPDTVYDGIRRSPKEFGYRNKLDLSFGDEEIGGPLTLGMHKTGTRYTVLDTATCALGHPDLMKIQTCIREYCADASLPFYNKLTHIGYLRYVMLRRSESTGDILIVLAVSTQQEHDFQPMVKQLLDIPLKESAIAGIHLAHCDRYADALLPDTITALYGTDHFYESLLGLSFKVTLFSFFQTNTGGAEVLYDTVREYVRQSLGKTGGLEKKPVIYDLYSGTGTIAQLLSPAAEHVYGIEIIGDAVEAARKNAALNGLTNCTFLTGDVPEILPAIPEKPDFVILDPPREGVHDKALRQVEEYGIDHIVYVSCKATSFVRDMVYLRRSGWRMERYALVDMFPETQHVETVVLLSKGEISSKKIRVEFPLEEMDMSGFQQGATYDEIKKYVLIQHGLKVSSLFIAQIKRKCGLEMGENYNLPKDENGRVPQCTPEKEAAIMDALRYFHMIA